LDFISNSIKIKLN